MTVRFIADENFNRRIVTGLQRRVDDLDVVRVQGVGLLSADDPTVLDCAAEHGRVLLTHDAATVPDFALKRIADGQPMAGVLVVAATLAIGEASEDAAHGDYEAVLVSGGYLRGAVVVTRDLEGELEGTDRPHGP